MAAPPDLGHGIAPLGPPAPMQLLLLNRGALRPTPVFLAGESPWTEEPDGLLSMGSQRVRQEYLTLILTLQRYQYCYLYFTEDKTEAKGIK